ncbi:MAG TPA: radical SAM family heme chaperone HemW [Leptolyngbyaceae cyanobacterium]
MAIPLQSDAAVTRDSFSFPVPRSAYVHIPFCRRRCFYCDFPISVMGDNLRGETSGTVEQYVQVLCQEIEATPSAGEPLETVFFGGGTPSLLSVQQLERILTTLDQCFGFAPNVEISMEMDPGTFDLAHLQGYRALGVNRISLGVQSLHDELLKACGRTHTVTDVRQAVDWLHHANTPSWSLDLISGLPHQTMAMWEEGLKGAIALCPNHLSVYDLTVEPQTVFAHRYEPGDHPLPTDEQTAQMYRLAQHSLTTAGYDHYEISNYAQPGHQCRHNRTYWENQSYYGFGMGATSYVNGQRYGRPRKIREYFEWVDTFIQQGGTLDATTTPATEQFLDSLMLGLRLAEGVSGKALVRICSVDKWQKLLQCLEPHLKKGWVILELTSDAARLGKIPGPASALRLRLSDPEGFLFSNVVLVDLFEAFADDAEAEKGVSSLQ